MAAKAGTPQRPQGAERDIIDLLMGGVASMFPTFFTNPIEVVKTRLQLQGELKKHGTHQVFYKNVPHGIYVIARTDGLLALQNGLPAFIGFQFFLNTFRLGTFRMAERRGWTLDASGKPVLLLGAVAAGVGGGIGSMLGTPFYLVKTRMQAQAAKNIAVGHQHKHESTFHAIRDIYKKEGFKGLFRGLSPQIGRGTAGSCSQMLGFTFAKESLRERGLLVDRPLMMSFVGANLGGLVMTFFANPFDVVATRLSNQPVDAQHRGLHYKGTIDCMIKMLRSEGIRALYKGVGANYLRLGPHTVGLLVCWDQLRLIEDYIRS